ncbi:hypothetical protein BKA63DRAFT_507864 [Paraphoma chrysanthemicola]|nr:hypothetical protein BKA63DRAFT_507864 [Paraphoma chrysanthemicola]
MPEITFVFGPEDSFFFDCPKAWKFHGLPQTLRQLFNSSMAPQWRIAQPYCVALAPGVKSFKNSEPLWYAGCKTLTGEDKLYHSQAHFEQTYADLARWTKSFPQAPRSCFVTFGQNLSYFACAPGRGSIWGGIPSELEDKVRKAIDTPLCVGLGKHNAWVVLYPDGYIAWKFYGHYSALDKILAEAAPRSVAYVAISPYHKEHYFVAFRDRSIKYNFKGAPKEWMALMTEVFEAWAAESVQKQPLPFTQPYAQPNPYSQPNAYVQQQAYPQGQPWPQAQPQQPYQQAQAAYNYMTPAELPAQLAGNPIHSAMTSPAPSYRSPVPQPAVPNAGYGYGPPQGGAIEMLAELPAETMLAAPAPVPIRSTSTDVSSSSLALLARDLWGADSKLEEEKVPV